MASITKKISLISQSASLFRDENLSATGITGFQAKYLLEVSNNEGISQDGLARILMVNKSNVARQVGALEVAGYLKREQSGEDKRVMLVYTTDRGKEAVPEIRRVNALWRAVLLTGFSVEEQEELSRMLDVMVSNAEGYLNVRQ